MSSVAKTLVLSQYKEQLRAAQKFKTWNFRQYFTRRTREEFRLNRGESDPAKIKNFLQKAREQTAVLERQGLINSLYAQDDLVINVQRKYKLEHQ